MKDAFYIQKAQLILPTAMSVASVGAALAQMLMDDEIRPLFGCRADFDSQDYPVDQYLDIFSGRVYKNYLSNGLFQNPDDIGLMIVVDGFSPKHQYDFCGLLCNEPVDIKRKMS